MELKTVSKANFAYDLNDFKLFAKIDSDVEDALISEILNAVFVEAEKSTNRVFSTTTFEYYTDKQTEELPRSPFQSVVSVEKEENGAYVAYNDYEIDDKSDIAKITFKDKGDFKVTFTAGYANIPDDVKIWGYVKAATLYENRTEFDSSSIAKIDNPFIDSILAKYKVRTFI